MQTPHEQYENLGRINELLMEAQQIADDMRVAPIRVTPLRSALSATQRIAQEHHAAGEILLTHDLAEEFPNGEGAPDCLTARQIMYLASLNYQRPSREMIGLPPSRPCKQPTKDGGKCSASSLLFTRRAVCASHATAAERERNRKAKEEWNTEHPDYKL